MGGLAKRVLLTMGILVLAFIELFTGALGCGRVPFRVCGTVTDAAGVPIEGTTLLTLFHPELALQDREQHRATARMYMECSREDRVRMAPIVGSARTDASGAFEIVVGFGISHRYGGLTGIPWFTERGSPFHVARALLVEKEGCEPLVFETREARWIERPEGRIAGTLDVGTIRLARR
ncbi:MAG: hypothetical protein L6Q95_11860 [Planctomycetes bacterium]|nr:hypothetical protein [Planctomycetota bacterium]